MSLRLFSPAAPRRQRRQRLIVAVVLLLASAAVIWPIYGWFGSATPQILGLPLSMAWVVLWLLVVFAALLWLYRCDVERERAHRAGTPP